MKSIIAALLASAAIVSAQISALPLCGITCGLQAANAINCFPVTNFNCTCQYSNQALILPILQSCLAKSCTDSAQSSAAISAGEGICQTVSQTASSMASYNLPARTTAFDWQLPSYHCKIQLRRHL
ncbi:hypothetical protein AMS68_003837 [Peltaster fructicola]|uniref:CFEM domain-containing protein n=1 Tax=Peltaster fructicola TaxID=286661 RepID=A0A6H0XV47_9PEZI|nr:hypothetical protein AMS68_003837 [Peltaster fructicola]